MIRPSEWTVEINDVRVNITLLLGGLKRERSSSYAMQVKIVPLTLLAASLSTAMKDNI